MRGLTDDLVQRGLGAPSHLGRAAWVECDGVHVVLVDRRAQAFSPDLFTNAGVPLDQMRIAVVKSTAHFRAGFAPDRQPDRHHGRAWHAAGRLRRHRLPAPRPQLLAPGGGPLAILIPKALQGLEGLGQVGSETD